MGYIYIFKRSNISITRPAIKAYSISLEAPDCIAFGGLIGFEFYLKVTEILAY